jgi:hypothetical protein
MDTSPMVLKKSKNWLNDQRWTINLCLIFQEKNPQKLIIGANFKLEIETKTQHWKFFDFENFKNLELELQN